MFDDIQVVVPPVDEPVTIDQLRKKARIDTDEDDALLDRLIIAARERCELFTRRSLMTQTLDVWYTETDGIFYYELPRGTVQEIVSVNFYDPYGVATLQESSIYLVQRETLLFTDFPVVYGQYHPRVVVRIISGYGSEPEHVPSALREGILELAAHMYDHPGGEGPETQYAAQATRAGLPPQIIDKWRAYQIVYV